MLSQVVELIESKRRFAITSHIRPDGDSLGSSLGLYWLLRALDKEVEVVMRDAVPHAYQKLPGTEAVRVTPRVDRPYDAVFVIECSDITRPGLERLEEQLVVNIDHHSTTSLFGTINWIDSTASAQVPVKVQPAALRWPPPRKRSAMRATFTSHFERKLTR